MTAIARYGATVNMSSENGRYRYCEAKIFTNHGNQTPKIATHASTARTEAETIDRLEFTPAAALGSAFR
jgi:hypothetical protein